MATQAYEGRARSLDVGDQLEAFVAELKANALPKPGDVIDGRFVVVGLLGEGAMARVFEVQRITPSTGAAEGPIVALKVLDTDPSIPAAFRAEAARRFQREAMTLAELDHPNIVRHLDFGVTPQGAPYLLMDRVQGRTLYEIMEDPTVQLAPRDVARIAGQLAAALAACHASGIVHRDMKPENVVVSGFGTADERAVLVDFGIARVRNRSVGAKITLQHQILGTPRYMSPEHVDAAKAGPASDLYSLGVIVYEMLSGRAPFESESELDTVMRHINEAPARLMLADVDRDQREIWQRLVECLLRKTPDERPADAQHVAELLGRLANVSEDAGFAGMKVRPRRFHTQQTLLLRDRPPSPATSDGPEPVERRRRGSWRRLKAAVKTIF